VHLVGTSILENNLLGKGTAYRVQLQTAAIFPLVTKSQPALAPPTIHLSRNHSPDNPPPPNSVTQITHMYITRSRIPGALPTNQYSFMFARQTDYPNPYIQVTYFLWYIALATGRVSRDKYQSLAAYCLTMFNLNKCHCLVP